MPAHISVMLNIIVKLLADIEDGLILDCTIGAGGHSAAIMRAVGKMVHLMGFDNDPMALAIANKVLYEFADRVSMINTDYSRAAEVLDGRLADRLLVDLGISSMQLSSERGFSFQGNQPLDMRMDPSNDVTALDILRDTPPDRLTTIFGQAGVARPRAMVRAVKNDLQAGTLKTTEDLARISRGVLGHHRKHDAATLPFMALRLAVNHEMESLERFLNDLEKITAPGGKVAILTFHSIEDRLVKRAFVELRHKGWETPYKKGLTPDEQELQDNPRARSARLRYIRRPG